MHIRKSNKQQQSRRGGFTLLELLIVLGIILAIAAMVVPNLLGRQQEANIKQTRINIANFDQATKQYAASHNAEFPQGGQTDVVQMLMSGESSEGQVIQPYLEAVPKDAWGIPLFYEYPNTKNSGESINRQFGRLDLTNKIRMVVEMISPTGHKPVFDTTMSILQGVY